MRARLIVACFAVVMTTARAPAEDLPAHYRDVVAYNGRLYQMIKEATARCPGIRPARTGVEGLRTMYDPGPELQAFETAQRAVALAWTGLTPRMLAVFCREAFDELGPKSKTVQWLARSP